jgi:hypothetical protein
MSSSAQWYVKIRPIDRDGSKRSFEFFRKAKEAGCICSSELPHCRETTICRRSLRAGQEILGELVKAGQSAAKLRSKLG